MNDLMKDQKTKPLPLHETFLKLAALSPIPEASELLRLPDGVIPEIPEGPLGLYIQHLFQELLIQAFIHAMAHDKDFDRAAGLRRLCEAIRLVDLSCSPKYSLPDFSNLREVILLTTQAPGMDRRRLAELAGVLIQQDALIREPSRKERILRYHAHFAHEELIAGFEDKLKSNVVNTNTFGYLFNGKPGHVWARANAGVIRREFDQAALALADGSEQKIYLAFNSLNRTLIIANVSLDTTRYYKASGYFTPSRVHGLTSAAIELALWSYVRERAALPKNLGELTPDYLAAPLPAHDGRLWILQGTVERPVLWLAEVRPVSGMDRIPDPEVQDPDAFIRNHERKAAEPSARNKKESFVGNSNKRARGARC